MKMRRHGTIYEYILEADRESEEPTVFKYYPLTWEQMAEVNKETAMSIDQAMKVNAIYLKAQKDNRELTTDEQLEINQIAPMDIEAITKLNKQHAKACRLGLSSIENLRDVNNKCYDISVEDFVKHVDVAVIQELGTAIIQSSKLDEQTSKN